MATYTNGNSNGHVNGNIGAAHEDLTPHQRHYFAKMLAQLAMSRDWAAMTEVGELGTYGPPFDTEHHISDKKLKKRTWPEAPQPPILRYMYRHFLLHFPGLKEAPQKYWTKTVQPVWDDFASRNLAGSIERSEVTKRRTIAIAFTNYFGTVFFMGLKAVTPNASLACAPSRPTEDMMRKIDDLFPAPQTHSVGGFFVSIVKIDIARVKTKEGENTRVAQYMICTRTDDDIEKFVYRDYATFNKFDSDLETAGIQKPTIPSPGASGFPSKENLQLYLRSLLHYFTLPNRDPDIDFKVKSFLMGFALDLSAEKQQDLRDRVRKEEQRLSDGHAIWVNTGEVVKERRAGWRSFVDSLMYGNGLDDSFEVVKNTPHILDLPPHYRRATEWARIYVAYSFHYLFVAAPNAKEAFYILQVLHHFFPYAIAKQLLKIANPAHMIKAIVTLLFGDPLGTKSVFSRVFAYLNNKDAKVYKKQIDELKKKISDSSLSDKIKAYVDASKADQDKIREKSHTNNVDLVISILVGSGLSAAQEKDVLECFNAFQDGVRKGDTSLLSDNQTENSVSGLKASKFKWLKRLLRLESLKRVRKDAIQIWEGTFQSFFRDVVDLYLPILSAISKASNLSARLGDLQRAIDDIIKTVLSSNRTPSQFIALCERHEQSLYLLVHECHANGKGLTQELIEWFRRGLIFMSEGMKNSEGKPVQVNLESILATDPALAPKILEEIDYTAKYVRWSKARFEISLRTNLIGNKLNINADTLCAALMEAEGENVSDRDLIASASGIVDWAYFYDPQVVDSATQATLEGEDQPGAIDDDDDAEFANGGSTSNFKAPSMSGTGAATKGVSKKGMFLKPPVLTETRKLVDAYLRQITPALNDAADHEQWAGKVKGKK